ncbi:molecular chaperone DnaJ [Candidatus Desulfovibrio trichonymphae]|uniref:Chaperone protein DnaJ n=1 Tax=Candidatus Desulfovibrio trichonymphae TaxID=1725232 RepID=A0A1J1DSR5_9BACT|nr:molecular chaperone DnaJ [Candidatus Desulfovibrio trichonymphae]BAV91693.1 chaperone protein DnaJ [Candidatus Desulfovibrio trichonymphae]GHU91213.1 chaperone protein DnaJ [Deltaproteobacteria bacterium]GHU94814.1 chaperone protein DnaJ [Deltaproteobacteria bacterium]GHV00032.1 chaperone protein DnaJ [Deltaproteobacteria bacterium]
MTQRDYYEVLNVTCDADGDEIKRAYRKLAMQYHPDRNPGNAEAEQKFKAAAEAYDVLRDPEKRARYDRFGHAGVQDGGAGGFGNAEDIFAHFSDIFGDLFGFSSASRGPRAMSGADLRYNLTISFAQAAKGDEITLSLPKRVTCKECGGSGAAPGVKAETCRQCDGSGQIHRSQGFFQIAMPCPICRGSGRMILKPCPRCRGEGIMPEMRELLVRVPAGVDTDTRLRVRGEGEPGVHGGPPGDLYVVLSVEQDKCYRREGQNLLYTQEITFVQAALGHRIEVPGLDGPLPLEISKGIQSGTLLRLGGAGLPFPGRSRRGDMLVEIRVLTPTRLSDRQVELLREFEKAGEDRPVEKVKRVAKKIKKAMGI